jgi:hypothetical protein
MPDANAAFGYLCLEAVAKERLERTAAGKPPPTKDEIAAMIAQLHQDDMMCRFTAALKSVVPKSGVPRKKSAPKDASEETWLAELSANPVYAGIDVQQELGKAKAWASVRPGTQVTRRRFVQWLNKALTDRPLASGGSGTAIAVKPTETASLGALQVQLKRVEDEMTDILHPGGAAYKTVPTGDKLTRYQELQQQRTTLKNRIEGFGR